MAISCRCPRCHSVILDDNQKCSTCGVSQGFAVAYPNRIELPLEKSTKKIVKNLNKGEVK